MACKPICKMCKNLIISDSVTYSATNGLLIDIPSGTYANGSTVCIVVADSIPTATPIGAAVSITIGGADTTLYPLLKRDGSQALAAQMRSRCRYCTTVQTTATGGSFRLAGALPCCEATGVAPYIQVPSDT